MAIPVIKSWIFSINSPVFRVTWSFRNHPNMLIWCARNLSFYHHCWTQLCCLIFLWKSWYIITLKILNDCVCTNESDTYQPTAFSVVVFFIKPSNRTIVWPITPGINSTYKPQWVKCWLLILTVMGLFKLAYRVRLLTCREPGVSWSMFSAHISAVSASSSSSLSSL